MQVYVNQGGDNTNSDLVSDKPSKQTNIENVERHQDPKWHPDVGPSGPPPSPPKCQKMFSQNSSRKNLFFRKKICFMRLACSEKMKRCAFLSSGRLLKC